MSRMFFRSTLIFFALLSFGPRASYPAQVLSQPQPTGVSPSTLHWQSTARLHHGVRSTPGDLVFTASGIEFRSEPQFSHRWALTEIKTFELIPRRLVLTDYENRRHHLPGVRHFRFDLKEPVPPAVAAELASRVSKPVINSDPDAKADAFFTIAARHGTRFGGTNGMLRFRAQGIDYVTTGTGGSRSWRWSEIQTIANPDPYHFGVGGYRETFDFELKQPLPRELFDRLWERVYARDLNVAASRGGEQHAE
jgi:hypothetical protein